MKTKIIEVVSTSLEFYGKFMVARFEEEWSHPSEVQDGHMTLLRSLGWSDRHILVVDLSVGHGAIFRHGGFAAADVAKLKIEPSAYAYLAGLFDGEGTVTVARHSRKQPGSLCLYVRIGMDDPSPLHLFKELWGGAIVPFKKRSNGRQQRMWQASARRAAECLTALIPFLQVKHERARLGLAFQALKRNTGGGGYTPEEVAHQVELGNRIRSLNSGKGGGGKPLKGTEYNPAAWLDRDSIRYTCPMFEPFMEWLYEQDLAKLDELPATVELPMVLGVYQTPAAKGAGE